MVSPDFPNLPAPPNHCHVNKVSNISHAAGHAGGGHEDIEVYPDKVFAYYSIEDGRTRQKMVAAVIAHEIGHVYLGIGIHVNGSTSNIMTDNLGYLKDALSICNWPSWNQSQINQIRERLGH